MIVGIPWYKRGQWDRWRDISADRAGMAESYDEWEHRAEEAVRDFVRKRFEVHKVVVDIDEFMRWADRNSVVVDGFARSDFANLKLGKSEMRRRTATQLPAVEPAELKGATHDANGVNFAGVWEPYLRRPKACLCPIFRDSPAGPAQIGSAVLLSVGAARFLLTAAHVTDERHDNVLLVPAKQGFVELFGTFIETDGRARPRRSDTLDVAVVKLPDDLVARLHDDFLFLEHEDCDLEDITTAGDAYTMIGYPARKSGREKNCASSELLSLSGSGVTDRRVQQLSLNPLHNIAVQLRMNRTVDYSTMRRRQFGHPEGMSGGGIFAWNKELSPAALAQPKLVGIVTEYHPHHNVFVGTRLHAFIVAMHRNDPSLPIRPVQRSG